MKLPEVSVHLENGTSHTFQVPDAQHALNAFQTAVNHGRPTFSVGSHTLFQTSKVTFVTYAKASTRSS